MLRDLQVIAFLWISGDVDIGTRCLLRALESCPRSSGGEVLSSMNKDKRVPEVRGQGLGAEPSWRK